MSRVKLGFSVSSTVFKQVDMIAKSERRTKSELLREMVRVYQQYREHRDLDELHWVTSIIAEAKTEESRRPTSVIERLAEGERLVRSGIKQAKKVGIRPASANRIIHERRITRNS